MTAMQNIAQDFGWVAAVFDYLSGLVTRLGPLIVLFGGIWLFYLKKARERQDELRRERQVIYLQYLAELRDWNSRSSDNIFMGPGILTINALGPHHEALQLVAPDNVVRASLMLIKTYAQYDVAIQAVRKSKPPFSKEEIQNFVDLHSPVLSARSELISRMRNDVLQGSKISAKLTLADEVNK